MFYTFRQMSVSRGEGGCRAGWEHSWLLVKVQVMRDGHHNENDIHNSDSGHTQHFSYLTPQILYRCSSFWGCHLLFGPFVTTLLEWWGSELIMWWDSYRGRSARNSVWINKFWVLWEIIEVGTTLMAAIFTCSSVKWDPIIIWNGLHVKLKYLRHTLHSAKKNSCPRVCAFNWK